MIIHYDELWKNIIEKLFPHFLAFFMPKLYVDVDLSKGYEFLDTELQEIKLKGRKGKNITDKLVKVRKRSQEVAISGEINIFRNISNLFM